MILKKEKNEIELYDHQTDALIAMSMSSTGQILMATGTGKTFVQAAHISQLLNEPSVISVIAPRIMLTYQLMEEFNKYLATLGLFPELMFVHSGGTGNQKELSRARSQYNKNLEVIATTNSAEIKEKIRKAHSKNQSIIIFSTYDSLERVGQGVAKAGQKVKCAIFDEAHYLVQDGYNKTLSNFQADQKYFFTATARHTKSDKSIGMNNKELFGDVLYEFTIASAIGAGMCVRPRGHILETDAEYNTEDFKKSIPKIIYRAAQEHQEQIYKENEIKNNMRQPKMLVALKGTENIDSFFESEYCKQLIGEGYIIYAISSSPRDRAVVNSLENTLRRPKWLKEVKDSLRDPNKKVIVLHYDILSEGIDASDFSGVLLLRNMGISKFLQTFGRISRLNPEDRKAFANGDYDPNDTEKMRKPYAYVVYPKFTKGDNNNDKLFKEFIEKMRTLGADLNDYIVSPEFGDGGGADPDEFLDDLEEKERKMGKLIEEIYSDVESEEAAKKLYKAADVGSFIEAFGAI